MSRLTRIEIYHLVWLKPLSKIAEEQQIDPIRLANACDQHEIPRPPAGYWQKMHYGKKISQPPLSNQEFKPDFLLDMTSLTKRR